MRIGSLGLIAVLALLVAIIGIASAAQWEEDSYLNFIDGAAENVNVIDEGSGDGSLVLSTHATSGKYTSNWYNTGAPRKYIQINWQAEIPEGTSVKFQIRTMQNGYVLGPIGPTGTMDSYYETSGELINAAHEGYSEIQYIAYLSTTNVSKTPKIKMVQISYSDEAVSPIIVSLGSNSPSIDPPVAPVPEPLSIVLVGIGLIALLGLNIFKK